MKLTKLILSTVFTVGMTSANAQYMGFDSLSSTKNFTPVTLINLINNKNEEGLEHWIKDQGRTIPYQEKTGTICYLSEGHNKNEASFTPKGDNPYQGIVETLARHTSYAILSPCATIPLSYLIPNINLIHTEQSIKQFGRGGQYSLNDNVIETTAFNLKYAEEFLNGLKPNQWEQLPFIVTNEQLPLDMRLKALGMLENFYSRRATNDSKEQKALYDTYVSYAKAKPDFVAENMAHNLYVNPYNYIFNSIIEKMTFTTNALSKANYYQKSNIDKFTMKFWMDQEQIDLNKFKFDSYNMAVLEDYLKTYNNAVILKKIMKNPSFNINEQNINGETFMHKLFLRNLNYIKDNVIYSSFLRSLLNKGADPRLLNNKKETAFMIFESKRGGGGDVLFDAFALKEYNK